MSEKFLLSGTVTISVYTAVEARTLQDAIRIAEDRDNMLIMQDGSNNPNECWMSDELDGEVYDIKED